MRLTYPFYIKTGLVIEVVAFLVKLTALLLVSGAAIFSETLHSLADLMDSLFVYVGMRLSLRPPDPSHPFGYGKEKFFWALVTALFMITVTATLSISKGVSQVLNPEPLHHVGFGIASMSVGV